jgi:hypothetical protein
VSPTERFHFSKGLRQAFKGILQTPSVGDIPMLILLKFLEFRQMGRHFLIGNPLTIPTVIPHAEGNEVISHNATDIQVVVQVTQCLVSKEFVFCISHGLSSIKSLTPIQWVGRHVTLRLR